MTSPLVDALSFEDAAVLPLGPSTAASALLQGDYLALRALPMTPCRFVIPGRRTLHANSPIVTLIRSHGYETLLSLE